MFNEEEKVAKISKINSIYPTYVNTKLIFRTQMRICAIIES